MLNIYYHNFSYHPSILKKHRIRTLWESWHVGCFACTIHPDGTVAQGLLSLALLAEYQLFPTEILFSWCQKKP